MGNCNLVKYDEELPKIYQNFDKVDGVARKDIGKVSSLFLFRLNAFCNIISFHS